jgi:hypothetical protein
VGKEEEGIRKPCDGDIIGVITANFINGIDNLMIVYLHKDIEMVTVLLFEVE